MARARLSWQAHYEAHDARVREAALEKRTQGVPRSLVEMHTLQLRESSSTRNGFARMRRCRQALEALDSAGWQRSFHQRLFHDHFLRACARVFWKVEPGGEFARDHQRILEANGWDHLHQEVLVSTPRRFGKTISISMFSAALVFSCPDLKLSIYSTCKRISQMLLQNIQMFLRLIYEVLKAPRLKVVRANCEEIFLQGNDGLQDLRVCRSFPSKVGACLGVLCCALPCALLCFALCFALPRFASPLLCGLVVEVAEYVPAGEGEVLLLELPGLAELGQGLRVPHLVEQHVLRGLLEGHDGVLLHPDVPLVPLRDLAHDPLERGQGDHALVGALPAAARGLGGLACCGGRCGGVVAGGQCV